jgi:hypothetical protein
MASLRRRSWTKGLGAATLVLLLGARGASAYDWLQFGGDPQHSGRNVAETMLTPANVATLAVKYQVTLPGTVDGAPVFLENVSTPGGLKDLLFVTVSGNNLVKRTPSASPPSPPARSASASPPPSPPSASPKSKLGEIETICHFCLQQLICSFFVLLTDPGTKAARLPPGSAS